MSKVEEEEEENRVKRRVTRRESPAQEGKESMSVERGWGKARTHTYTQEHNPIKEQNTTKQRAQYSAIPAAARVTLPRKSSAVWRKIKVTPAPR